MTVVCFYFQVHQPFRLRPDPTAGDVDEVFDHEANSTIMRKVAEKCYLPTNRILLDLIKRYNGRFRVAFSITGVAIEQMKLYAPQVLESFVALAQTGAVEFLAETYYHSLAAIYNAAEFRDQVDQHSALIQREFHQTPRVFRNTELIYDDSIGRLVQAMGFRGVIAEGADQVLKDRTPNQIYTVPGNGLPLLLKNYRLSDDIAFRFSDRRWPGFPLSADTFASWIHALDGAAQCVNLFMDYETFGEHQWAESGIFEFLRQLPEAVLRNPNVRFETPRQLVTRAAGSSALSFPRLTSWADQERDLSAWQGNQMQQRALRDVYAIGPLVKERGDRRLLDRWRKLLTSDHFYYMSTKGSSDGDVHAYFSPYESPYEAFSNFMQVLMLMREDLDLCPASMKQAEFFG